MANDSKTHVKQEHADPNRIPKLDFNPGLTRQATIIELSSSDSECSHSFSSDDDSPTTRRNNSKKKRRTTGADVNAVLPAGFLDPLPSKQLQLPPPLPSLPNERSCLALPPPGGDASTARRNAVVDASAKQFWKAGDYEGAPGGDWDSSNGDI